MLLHSVSSSASSSSSSDGSGGGGWRRRKLQPRAYHHRVPHQNAERTAMTPRTNRTETSLMPSATSTRPAA